jgi:hypothetical protein
LVSNSIRGDLLPRQKHEQKKKNTKNKKTKKRRREGGREGIELVWTYGRNSRILEIEV